MTILEEFTNVDSVTPEGELLIKYPCTKMPPHVLIIAHLVTSLVYSTAATAAFPRTRL
jgi:hypothetical protein